MMKKYIRYFAAALAICTILITMIPVLSPPAQAFVAVTPDNVFPPDNSTEIGLNIELWASGFNSTGLGDLLMEEQWQIATNTAFTPLTYDSGIQWTVESLNPAARQHKVPAGILKPDTTYYWHVRYQNLTGWTPWSSTTSFTTIAVYPPCQPTNIVPADKATDVWVVSPVLLASDFAAINSPDTQKAAHWQVTASKGDYTSSIFDSGIDGSNLTSIDIPTGCLSLGTTYYWRVRYQDYYDNWSLWSKETSFTTINSGPPSRPVNLSPINNTTEQDMINTVLLTNEFVSPYGGATQSAAQWQITTVRGDYNSPIFDSGIDSRNLGFMLVPASILKPNTVYYWHVRQMDSLGRWSMWSIETSFQTIALNPPKTPANIMPLNNTVDISQTPTLQSNPFTSLNGGTLQAAARWQIYVSPGSYANPVYDSGVDATALTSLSVPEKTLKFGTKYYWHVKYMDNNGNWSDWSAETSFTTTVMPPNAPTNSSPAGDDAKATQMTPTLAASAFNSDSAGNFLSAQWQITVTAGNYSNPLLDTKTSSISLAIPSGKLSYSTTYYWHVRYQDTASNWSVYSPETSFTTLPKPPVTPSNVSPADGMQLTVINPTLTASPFASDTSTQAKAQWQITTVKGDYLKPVIDITDSVNKNTEPVTTGRLNYGVKYYWHVRYQDATGLWSTFSAETSFTTPARPPLTPTNISPADGSIGLSVTPTLNASAFAVDSTSKAVQQASQWQISNTPGDYSSPVIDSTVAAADKTGFTVPAAKLEYGVSYYWHVRYQDSYGGWSNYSDETVFTTSAQLPATPTGISPVSGAQASLTPVLSASAFSSGAATTQKAAQWQISSVKGNYSNPVFDSGIDLTNKVGIVVPAAKLSGGVTYYWHVRYQDAGGTWSDYSAESSFITAVPSVTTTNASENKNNVPLLPIILGVGVVVIGSGALIFIRRRRSGG
jgi:hypothetical protein